MIADPNDLQITNELLIDLTDHLHTIQVQIQPHQRFLEIQCVKFAFHTSTIIELYKGSQIKNVKFPDLSSILLLLRAQLEAYLMFYYLNIDNITLEERGLRLLLFEASGLAHRQKFVVNQKNNQLQKDNELTRLNSLKDEIKKNAYFQNLGPKYQTELIKKVPARMVGWIDLIKRSHLRDEIFIDMWSLCSNYAHSEYISLIQFKDYIVNVEELSKALKHITKHASILTAILCFDLMDLFPQIVPFYKKNIGDNSAYLDTMLKTGRKTP